MKNAIVRFLKDEDGATAIEYGLVAGLAAVGIIAAFGALNGGLLTAFTALANMVKSNIPGGT